MSINNIRILSEQVPILEIKNMPNVVISGIYKIENIIDHKVYIGKSVNVISRFKRGHLLINNEVNPHLKNAILKYGYENFTAEVIKETHDLDYWEIFLIQIYDARNKERGYNICQGGSGGDTFTGRHHSEETKKLMSLHSGSRGKVYTPEQRYAMGSRWRGKHRTEEEKRIISEKLKGKNRYTKTEEHRRKISETLKGNVPGNKGMKMSEEFCQQMSEQRREYYKTEKGEHTKELLRKANIGNIWWNNGVIEIKSKEQPKGFICGRIHNNRNKWFTNGEIDIRYTHALDETYRYGRTFPDAKCSYWNNGKISILANKCPNKDFVKGRLKESKNKELF